ncbi:MAG: plasmid pRiA4b ORF-3 family protein [Bacteroidota bacterium]
MYFSDQAIIRDFDQFLAYLETNSPLFLTQSRKQLKAVDLLALNGQLVRAAEVVKKRPTQQDFIGLNFFFYSALAADLINLRHQPKGPVLHIESERLVHYRSLSTDERYGFLLQTLWCYLDWDRAFELRSFFEVSALAKIIEKGDGQASFTFTTTTTPLMTSRSFVALLRYFGLIEYTLSTETGWHNKQYIGLATLTLTELGQKILPPLIRERPLHFWANQDPYLTLAKFERIYGPADAEPERPVELIDFFAVFQATFPEWQVHQRLYPIEPNFIDGTLTLKILLDPKCYRTISIPANTTLEDLHLAIQQVFGFDNDHLYAFFLNGTTNYKTGNVYSDPRGMVEPPEYPADEFTLQEIGLRPGKELLYLFDFGDNWMFLIQVMAIEDQTIGTKGAFELIESQGEAPEQYPEWE